MRLMRWLAGLLFAMAWLLPNHYFPWASFWQDFSAGVALALMFWSARPKLARRALVPMSAITVAVLAAVPLVQWVCGLIFYKGEAAVVCLYLAGFALAIACPSIDSRGPDATLTPLLAAVVAGSIASVGLAAAQWLDVRGLGIFLVDLAAGGRPYANLAQPNQLATLILFGLIAVIALYERLMLRGWSIALASAWLIFGLAMTQSRTAWIAMLLLLAWWTWAASNMPCRLRPMGIVTMAAGFAALVLVWPSLCEALLLVPARSFADQTTASGGRVDLWIQMLGAVRREPWLGYGWNQASVAQVRVAADYGPIGLWVEDSHNLALEFLIQQGIPLGLLTVGIIGVWLRRRARDCSEPTTALCLGAVLVVGAHALLEFPLDYAYFLLPVGLVVGYIEARSPHVTRIEMPWAALWAAAGLASLLLGRSAWEYADIEQRNRDMRFEQAGFGSVDASNPARSVRLLTQLEELPRFARNRARRDMSAVELDSMRRMAERYAYPPVLFRYAVASGLNGDPQTSRRILQVLCNVHSVDRCSEGRAAWRQMAAGAYPELRAVDPPSPGMPLASGR